MTTALNFTIPQKELAQALTRASGFVNSRSVLEIIKDLKLVADATSNTLRITGTDLSVSITLEVEAKIATACALCLPAATLTDAVNSLPPGTIEVFADTEKFAATFKTKEARVRLVGHDPDDYPLIPDGNAPGAISLKLPAADFHRALKNVAAFASTEQSRTNLTTVHMSYANDGRLLLAATDSYRLMYRYVPAPNDAAVGDIVANVPSDSIPQLVNLLAASREHDITLSITPNGISTSVINRNKSSWVQAHFHSALKDVRYPDFWAIVPKSHKGRLGFRVKELSQALRTVGTIAKIGIDQVTLEPDGDNLILTAKDGFAGEGVYTLPTADMDGEPCKMTLRRWYLEEALGWFDADDIVFLETTDSPRPLVILDRQPEEGKIIIMPMQV